VGLIAIDPGKVTGAAYFEDGELVRAEVCTFEECRLFIENAARIGASRRSGTCVIEVPQVYPGQQQKGDQNDLITLAVMVGQYVECARMQRFEPVLVKPREWKGQLPKDVCWSRVSAALSVEEIKRIPKLPKSKAHNMQDAIGIGMWFLKRRWGPRQ